MADVYTKRLVEVNAAIASVESFVPVGKVWVVTWITWAMTGYSSATQFLVRSGAGTVVFAAQVPADSLFHSSSVETRLVYHAGESVFALVLSNPASLTVTGYEFDA
jgi:hypothetical protein